jgi:hypothetical protein
MKNLALIIFWFTTLFFCEKTVLGQEPVNFSGFVQDYFQTHHLNENDTFFVESGMRVNYERQSRIWLPRLYPHGNFSVAAKAIYDYSKNYNIVTNTTCISNVVSSEWENIGTTDPMINTVGAGPGRINKIFFDPHYNLINANGLINKTIYASSVHGGLWRSLNDGNNWNILNTDIKLPISSVSDIAIDFNNSNNIFISTGLDGIFAPNFSNPNWGNVNPFWTIGIYRSTDFGLNWTSINDQNLMGNLQFGGSIRRIICNPQNSAQLFAATSSGLYVSNNSLSTTPTWSLVTQGLNTTDSHLRGLEFKPGDANTVYLSGKDIYKSINNGVTWQSMTGALTGLDISALPDFQIEMINLAVTNANPNNLYAYLVGSNPFVNGERHAYIFMYNGTSWTQLHYRNDNNNPFQIIESGRISIAVSPVDENKIYYGYTVVNGTTNLTHWGDVSGYNQNGCHADIHSLAFQPNVGNPLLFAATDGGISKATNAVPNGGWVNLNNGLQCGLVWTFDQSHTNKSVFVVGMQDVGLNVTSKLGNQYQWKHLLTGDGYGVRIMSEINPELFSIITNNTSLTRYYSSTGSLVSEYYLRPFDPAVPNNGWQDGVPKTFDLKIHPITGKIYMGFSELFERLIKVPTINTTPNTLWKLQSDISKTVNQDWARQITEVEISKSDPNFIYIVTGGVDYGNGVGVEPRLFKSSTGGNEGNYSLNKFAEITSLPMIHIPNSGISKPVITGIAVSPIDPNHLWITFSGYDPVVKVYSSLDGGISWQNDDPNGSLTNLPVNGVVYQDGTNDRLYIGTDAGVYVKDNSMSCWQRYGNIPNVRVTELKINPCSGKLVASTYGRGMWETDLLPSEDINGFLEINADDIWGNEKVVNVNIKINSGVTLTINSNVFMAAKTSIVVEPGGKLVVDGGKLTNSCGAFWQGIQVVGDFTQHQFPYSQPTYQGEVVITNGGTIENARNAISTWRANDYATTGGVLKIDNAHFINNRRSIEFLQYENFNPTTHSPTNNLSYIRNTDFIINDNYINTPSDFYSHISLWGVKGINITNCSFQNNITNKQYTSTFNHGIYSIDATYLVNGSCRIPLQLGQTCPLGDRIYSEFVGFTCGIEALGSGSLNTIYVDQARFDQNILGASVKNVNNIVVTNSLFDVGDNISAGIPSNLSEYGIYINVSTGFKIEENTFVNSQQLFNKTYGIAIKNSGEVDNQVYKNSMSNLKYGFSSMGINKDPIDPLVGLQFLCNNNSNNSLFDFNVSGSSANTGIRTFQGTYYPFPPAGNSFSHTNNNPESDYHNKSNFPIVYMYNLNGDLPMYFSPNKVFPSFSTSVNTCPSELFEFPLNELVMNSKEMQYHNDELIYLNILYNYYQLINGGNTPALLHEIQLSWPQDAWDLRSELLSQSPFLTETVLREVANRNILPQAMLLEICLANPQATRNEDFIRFLQEDIINPFPQSLTDLIIAMWDAKNSRFPFENSLSYYRNKLSKTADLLITNSILDPSIDKQYSTLWFNRRGSLPDYYSKIDRLIEDNSFESIDSIFTAILEKFNTIKEHELTQEQILEYDTYRLYVNFRRDLFTSGRRISQLNRDVEIPNLGRIADANAGRPSQLAKNILCYFYQICNGDELLDEGDSPERLSSNVSNLYITENKLTILPNPACTYVGFTWNLPGDIAKSLVISDISGKLILENVVNSSIGTYVWDCSKVENGIYFINIRNVNNVCKTEKFIINH